jgi:mono/diheme cytochrome c family protein
MKLTKMKVRSAWPRRPRVATLVLVALAPLVNAGLLAQDYYSQARFPEKSGAELYQSICQVCHMPDARGAVGAGAYPALAGNKHLQAALYPVGIVINGRKAMPAFGDALTDEQIAAVVNFVRSHFGNRYKDVVTPGMVKQMRSN